MQCISKNVSKSQVGWRVAVFVAVANFHSVLGLNMFGKNGGATGAIDMHPSQLPRGGGVASTTVVPVDKIDEAKEQVEASFSRLNGKLKVQKGDWVLIKGASMKSQYEGAIGRVSMSFPTNPILPGEIRITKLLNQETGGYDSLQYTIHKTHYKDLIVVTEFVKEFAPANAWTPNFKSLLDNVPGSGPLKNEKFGVNPRFQYVFGLLQKKFKKKFYPAQANGWYRSHLALRSIVKTVGCLAYAVAAGSAAGN